MNRLYRYHDRRIQQPCDWPEDEVRENECASRERARCTAEESAPLRRKNVVRPRAPIDPRKPTPSRRLTLRILHLVVRIPPLALSGPCLRAEEAIAGLPRNRSGAELRCEGDVTVLRHLVRAVDAEEAVVT